MRDHIINTAYELFSRQGVRGVGVDDLIAASGVAISTFYRHFRSKDDLVLAYLGHRFTERQAAISAALNHRDDLENLVLTVFDVFDGWFRQRSPEVVGLLQVLIEMGPEHPLGQASAAYLSQTRMGLQEAAAAAGLHDPEGFAWSCHAIIQGSIVADREGDPDAAEHGRRLAELLMRQHRAAEPHPQGQDLAS
ncbi:TetR/AcrR family transcriptional regulator [Sinomonas sp. R1AF57]|uniref:TetR/AcrR family transcriptional regulator n=1 Tax=Sinomonas sp. R1AF57 TaxID=2020377 RepID=UPI0021009E93|nr:TetR/AcrR family transcriptional regulator [Sinomonas sp. R1AF57]